MPRTKQSKTPRPFPWLPVLSLLAANGLTLFLFAHSNGSILQVLWVYMIQALVSAGFYYRRIGVLRRLELAYRKKHKTKDLAAFEKAVNYQIPNESIAFLVIAVLPLLGCLLFLVLMTTAQREGFAYNMYGQLTSLEFVRPAFWAIFWGGLAFATLSAVEYWHDRKFASNGMDVPNRYRTGRVAILSVIPLIFAIILGPELYFYIGGSVAFATFMVVKTAFETVLAIKGINI